MTGAWIKLLSGGLPMMLIEADRQVMRVTGFIGAPYGRSRHTVAQDRRAAAKRRARLRAKARGQA